QRLIVYPDAAAADLAAVEHEIVGACACAPLSGFQQMPIALERSGERMMHELVALLLLEPLEHRKVHDPEERERVRVEQPGLSRETQAQLAKRLRGRLVRARGQEKEIARTSCGQI